MGGQNTRQRRKELGQCVDCAVESDSYRCEGCRETHMIQEYTRPDRASLSLVSENDEAPDLDEPVIDAPKCGRCHLRLYLTPGQIKRGDGHVCLTSASYYATLSSEDLT